MQKTRKLLIVGVILSLILMCLFPTLGMAETTEHFSDEVTGNSSFTNSGFTFNLTGGRFVIANGTNFGWTGTAKDDYYMDNYGNYPAAAGILGSITSAASTFKVTDLYLFPGETGDLVSNAGTVIIRGKLSGVTKFTHTVASGSINTIGVVNNAYTYVDLSAYNSFAIDQLEFEVTGSLRYLAIDAFKHTSISPNSAPTDISLTASSVNENVAGNTTVGTLSSTDPDAGNTFTYTLVAGAGDTDNASFNISGNSLRITNSPDYETKNSYSVRVRSTDQGGLTFDKVFTITISDLNEAPTNISLSASSVNENVAGNTTVGTLSSTDPDAGNTFTYTLVAGAGDTDNASFNISGSSLRITNTPDYETKNSYSVRVRTTDQGSLTFEKEYTITINDVFPAVSSVSVPANGTYIAGDNLNFTVNFGENVTVNTGGGIPYIPITLATGGTVNASYISGTGTSALVFRYTVQPGNLDTDGVAVGASITPNGGTLKDAATNDANLTLKSIGSTAAVLVDAVAPTVNITSAASNPTNASPFSVTFTFSENVSGFAVGDITVGNGSAGNFATTNASTYTADITPTGQGAVTIDVAGGVASDSAGNNNTAAVQLSRTFDSVAPTVDNANASTVYNAISHTLIVKITETGGIATGAGSSAVDISKFTVKKGAESETLSIGQSSITITDPSTLTITIGGTDRTAVQAFSGGEGINAVDVAAGGITDKAGNSNINDDGNTVATDLAPTLQSAVRTDNTHINVTLSEGCTNISKAHNGGFSVYQTGTPGITYAVSAIAQGADNSHVVLTVANMSISAAEGVTVLYTAGGNGTVQDLTGNSLATDATGVNASAWDTSSPTISSASLSLNNTYLDITFSEGVYGANDGITALTAAKLALTFTQNSGSATNATISSVKQNNNAVEGSASALAGGETVVRVFLNITGTPSGSETIEIKPANATSVYDVGGNAAQIAQTTGVKTLNDKAAPTVTNLSPADNAVNINKNANLVITFNENVEVKPGNIYIRKTSDFSLVETIDVTGGLVTGSGTSTITINPGSDLQVSTGYLVMITSAAFADAAGNSFEGITDSTTWNFTTAALSSEISIKQGTNNIADGGSFDFGNNKSVNSNTDVQFTIENTGPGDLTITTPITIGGANADQFSIQTQPASPVAASGNTTFTVRFTPISAGAKTATLAIANNDSDENPYNITFTGTGIAPLMSIEGNSAAIANGDSSPSASDHTEFGTTAVTGGTVQRTFTIKNTGSAALNLTGTPKVDVTGANAAEFTVSSQPTSPIAATNGTNTFTVTFDPAGPGTRTATISIANDTTGTNPYTFDISGSGLCGIIITPSSGLTTTESGGTATFTVVLDCLPTADVTFNLASSNTSEGTVSPSSLTFTAANWNVPQTVTVTGVDDSTFDGSKSYQITTSAATSADPKYNGINPSDVSVSNTDNDSAPPTPPTPPPSNPEVDHNNQVIGSGTTLPNNTDHTDVTVAAGGTVTNNATLTDLTNSGTVTGGTVSGNSDNQGVLNGVTLSTGTTLDNAGGTVTGAVNNGAVFGGTVSGTVTNAGTISGLAPSGTTDPSYTVTISSGAVVSGGQINGSVTNLGTLNNVTIGAGTSLSFASGSGGQTGNLTGTVTFMTESGTGCVITIPPDAVFPEPGSVPQEGFVMTPEMLLAYAREHGWDVASRSRAAKASSGLIPEIPEGYVLVGGIVLSETGSRSSSDVGVSVPYVESLIPGGYTEDDIKALAYDHSENIWISVPSSRSGENALKISTKLITAYAAVIKTSTPPVPGTITVSQISGNTSEDGSIATFTVVLGSAPSSDVTIGLTSSDLTEGLASPSSLVFTPSNWSTAQTVTVTGVDDDAIDGDQPYFIVTGASVSSDPSYNGIDPSDVSLVNTDNDKENIFIPGQISPVNGAANVSMTPLLSVTEPGAISGFGTHTKTKWQVSRTSDFAPFDLVFSITASTSLYSVKVPYLALTPGSTYFWRARFVDEKGNETEWSQASKFTVVPVNPDDKDGDGVADAFEISAATDLDADGTDDGGQTDMLRTKTASGDVMMALKKSTNTLAVVSFISGQDTGVKTEGESLGITETRIGVTEAGSEAEVLLHSSKAFDKSCGWKAFDMASGWNGSSNASFTSDGKCVTLKLRACLIKIDCDMSMPF